MFSQLCYTDFIMKKVLLLQSRPEDVASDNEYEAFCTLGGIPEEMLVRVRMDQAELPDINLDDYSAVIMGGGPANFSNAKGRKTSMQRAFEPWLFALLERIVREDKPFFGACLGYGAMQMILGGRLSFDYGEPVMAVEVTKTPAGQSDPLLAGIPEEFLAFVGHKEGAFNVPEPAVELARSATCSQMLRHGNNVYATQFHPELNGPGLALRITTYRNAGYFPPEHADELTRMAMETDVIWPVQILKAFVDRYIKADDY